jgi:ankyrin repeat protein
VLPDYIYDAVATNDIQKVLNWLGPPPVDTQRINAKSPETVGTMLFCAAMNKYSDLLSILLQLGADVDPVAANGETPLGMCYGSEYNAQAMLLLEWGADISNNALLSKEMFIELALKQGNSKLANLLKSEFGGRRCEIINLPNRPDLIGKTCVVNKYLPDRDRYKVIFEVSKEVGLVGPENLKRRDRTPDDCGYYISYKNGSTTRHEFASKEECQAFIVSLTELGNSGDVDNDAEAEARAEQAAASLLAELEIDSSANPDKKGKKGKRKGNKKGRK